MIAVRILEMTHRDCLRCGVNRRQQPEHNQQHIPQLIRPRLRARPVVQHRGVHEAQRHAREAADERDELVKVRGAEPAHTAAEEHDEEAEAVLLPLDADVHLAARGEQACLHDADRGEELEGDGEEDRNGVEELDGLGELGGGVEVDDDDGLDLGAKGGIG